MSLVPLAWMAATLSLSTGAPPAPAALEPGDVTGVEILPSQPFPGAWRTEIVISLEGAVETRDFTMEGPNRIVVDLLNARSSFAPDALQGAARGGLEDVRASQYSEDVVRVVLQVAESSDYSVSSGDGYVRISLADPFGDFEPWEFAQAEPPAQAAASASPLSLTPAGPSSPLSTPLAQQEVAQRITVNFAGIDVRDVLSTFADISGRSIVPSAQVDGVVTADIVDQPWDVALQSILDAQGLAATEGASGIIRIDRIEDLVNREEVEPLQTRVYRLDFLDASDLEISVRSLLSGRGSVATSLNANALVVTDVPRVLASVEDLVSGLDTRRPQITIDATIVFVDRTGLEEFGVVYDLKDPSGNQLNQITPGAIDSNNDGIISADEQVPIGTNVVSLGGNSIAALGNANSRVVEPSIQFLTSLILGRHTLISFVEALSQVNLSDVQAKPQITTMDNEPAEILVGERTPIRVIDVASGSSAQGGGGGFPQATVQIEETGIILNVTPHVTAGNLIRMDVRAERSGLQLLDSDLGVNFNTQTVTTSMLVEDGQTAATGGLQVRETTELTAGIPLLKDLPLLGRLFRVTREETNQRDLIILITPHIQRD